MNYFHAAYKSVPLSLPLRLQAFWKPRRVICIFISPAPTYTPGHDHVFSETPINTRPNERTLYPLSLDTPLIFLKRWNVLYRHFIWKDERMQEVKKENGIPLLIFSSDTVVTDSRCKFSRLDSSQLFLEFRALRSYCQVITNTSENLHTAQRCLKDKLLQGYLENRHYISENPKYKRAMENAVILESNGSKKDN